MKRFVIAGTGGRGTGSYAGSIMREFKDRIEIAGLYDINPMRSRAANKILGTDFPVYDDFTEMLKTAEEMVLEASAVYWGGPITPERRTQFYERDVTVNKLERRVRKAVITHLSGSPNADVPYSLMLMSLVATLHQVLRHN